MTRNFKSNKKKKEFTSSIITSDKWVEYYELKIAEKLVIEKKKKERRLSVKKNGKRKSTNKKYKYHQIMIVVILKKTGIQK